MAPADADSPRYSLPRLVVHWLVAVLVALQYLFQNAMNAAFDALELSGSVGLAGFLVTTWHSLAGIAIGVLVLWRRQVAHTQPVPVAAGLLSGRRAAVVAMQHRVLDVLLLWMVVSGVVHYYAGWPFAGDAHAIGKWVLAAALLLHLSAALWHHLLRKDPVLRRMFGGA